MLSCLCPSCYGRSARTSADGDGDAPPAEQSLAKVATAVERDVAGQPVHATDAAAGVALSLPVGALPTEPTSGDAAPTPTALCSPFSTAQLLAGTGAEPPSPLGPAGNQSVVPATPAPPSPNSAVIDPTAGQPRSATFDATSPPAAHNSALGFSIPGEHRTHSQSRTCSQSHFGLSSPSAAGLSSPHALHLLQQATSSNHSAGAGTATLSLNTLPAAIPLGQLSTVTTLRSEGGTEATVRLPGDLSAVLPHSALLASEASTTRLVEYLSPDSLDHGCGGPANIIPVTGNSGASRPLTGPGMVVTGGGGMVSPAAAAARKPAAARLGPGGAGGAGFSLFGALQAFVQQQEHHQQDSSSNSGALANSATAVAVRTGSIASGQQPSQSLRQAAGSAAGIDGFRGFDSDLAASGSHDPPTARLHQVRVSGASAAPGGGSPNHNRNRHRPSLPPSPLGSPTPAGATGSRLSPSQSMAAASGLDTGSSGNWHGAALPPAGALSGRGTDGVGSETELALAAGMIIGTAHLGTQGSGSLLTTMDKEMVAAAPVPPEAQRRSGCAGGVAGRLGAAAPQSGGGGTAAGGTSGGSAGPGAFGRPLSRPHSFDGMTSLLSGNMYSFDDGVFGPGGGGGVGGGGGGREGVGAAGSDTDGTTRADNTPVASGGGYAGDGGGGGGGGGGAWGRDGVGGGPGAQPRRRAGGLHRTAERREFLSAARCINAVLQDMQVLSVLGAGAHGKVYKGALRDRFVAVKVIMHDVEVPPGITGSGLRNVPSSTASLVGAGGIWSGGGDVSGSLGSGSEGVRPQGAAAALAAAAGITPPSAESTGLGGVGEAAQTGSRSTSGSGARPPVHSLRYQRAGSSNLHSLSLTLQGGSGGADGSGGQAAGAPALPVLSLPGMPHPVVIPHKHMLEGLISASAQHPNIVETYRIVTQLLSSPGMPAFVVTRGSHTPLWETTNLSGAAMLGLANASLGGGPGGASGGGGGGGPAAAGLAASPLGSLAASGASGPGLLLGMGGAQARRMNRVSSLGPNRERGPAPSSPLGQAGHSAGGSRALRSALSGVCNTASQEDQGDGQGGAVDSASPVVLKSEEGPSGTPMGGDDRPIVVAVATAADPHTAGSSISGDPASQTDAQDAEAARRDGTGCVVPGEVGADVAEPNVAGVAACSAFGGDPATRAAGRDSCGGRAARAACCEAEGAVSPEDRGGLPPESGTAGATSPGDSSGAQAFAGRNTQAARRALSTEAPVGLGGGGGSDGGAGPAGAGAGGAGGQDALASAGGGAQSGASGAEGGGRIAEPPGLQGTLGATAPSGEAPVCMGGHHTSVGGQTDVTSDSVTQGGTPAAAGVGTPHRSDSSSSAAMGGATVGVCSGHVSSAGPARAAASTSGLAGIGGGVPVAILPLPASEGSTLSVSALVRCEGSFGPDAFEPRETRGSSTTGEVATTASAGVATAAALAWQPSEQGGLAGELAGESAGLCGSSGSMVAPQQLSSSPAHRCTDTDPRVARARGAVAATVAEESAEAAAADIAINRRERSDPPSSGLEGKRAREHPQDLASSASAPREGVPAAALPTGVGAMRESMHRSALAAAAAASAATGSSQASSATGDQDSAEFILDLLGQQAAAQRSASFRMRQRQLQQQQQQQQQEQQQQPPQQGVQDSHLRQVSQQQGTVAGQQGGGGGGSSSGGGGDGSDRPRLMPPVVPATRSPATTPVAAPPWYLPPLDEEGRLADSPPPPPPPPSSQPPSAKQPSAGGASGGSLPPTTSPPPAAPHPGSETHSGEDMPPILPYEDYMVADESGTSQVPPYPFGLSTALFSSYVPTEFGSYSGLRQSGPGGLPAAGRVHALRFSQLDAASGSGRGSVNLCGGGGALAGGREGGEGTGGGSRLQLPSSTPPPPLWGPAGSGDGAFPGASQPSFRDCLPSSHPGDSAASNASYLCAEASLALPPPLLPDGLLAAAATATVASSRSLPVQPAPPPAGAAGTSATAATGGGSGGDGGGGSAPFTAITNWSTTGTGGGGGNGSSSANVWLPTIDELTAGVVSPADSKALHPAVPGGTVTRSSAGSTSRNYLQRTISTGSAADGCNGGGGAFRTSNGSVASLPSIAGTQGGRGGGLVYSGQLMPADVQYDKLSWSNHTQTSASTNMSLNSGFTALLASINTAGGSNQGAGNSGRGNGGNGGASAGRAGPQRTHVLESPVRPGSTSRRTSNTPNAGADTLAASNNEDVSTTTTAAIFVPHSPHAHTRAHAYAQPRARGRGGSTVNAPSGDPDLRLNLVEPLSRSFTDARSSRTHMRSRQRVAAAPGPVPGSPWTLASSAPPGRERWQVLIVQELCTRGNLRDAIVSGMFHASNAAAGTQVIALRQLLDTAAEIASALAYLHSRAIVHGDLKTANVLLQRHDTDPRGFVAKLADFGLARQLGPRGAEDGLLVSRIGTVTHMAPETIRDNRVLLSSDVYSFGVILWELYCAQQPFANYTAFQLLSAVVQYDERPQFPVHCPPGYAALAVRCMAKHPQDRPTFPEVHRELLALRDGLFGGVGSGVPAPAPAPAAGLGAGVGVGLGGTITVPLTQARSEATRILQSHLQIVTGSVGGVITGGSGGGGGGGPHTTPGTLREGGGGGGGADSHLTSSLESWDVYSRAPRHQD